MTAPEPQTHEARRPHTVYAVGTEPDPRFSLANERTFLAWIRTSLAVLAAAVALVTLVPDLPAPARTTASTILCLAAILCSATGWRRWRHTEIALRTNRPLPGSAPTSTLAGATAMAGVVILAWIFASLF